MILAIPALPRESPTMPSRELWAESELDEKTIRAIRRRAALEGCKWDAQVGDITTLAAFPVVMERRTWDQLAAWAEQLSAEMQQAEEEISHRPELLPHLGLPAKLRKTLAADGPLTPGAGRVIRFDFHLTTEGWRISEANSDVPGGFSEGSFFTAMMAEHFADLRPAGNPGALWADAVCAVAGQGGAVALLSATGYMEDHQVNSFLAARLRERGCSPHLVKPDQIRWKDGRAWLETSWCQCPLDAILRFYQAEWLARLPMQMGWEHFFRGGKTPVANYGLAAITESKRFPLVWDFMKTPLPAWRHLLPETRDPRDVDWSRDESWLLKTAMCNTGDTVSIRGLMSRRHWLQTRLVAMLSPGNWIAQKRFQSSPISTPLGERHVCVGVYTVNGRAAGAYARLSEKPVIDFAAIDVALLIKEND